MAELNKKYITVLDNIKSNIQLSEELKVYLDSEEDEDYKAFVSKYEGSIHELYEKVANEAPLELEALEEYLLDEQFEGLYLPKALGYAVLRGNVNENTKYYRPQDHFSRILDFIINSSNFEQIKQRVGQSIQVGFALSSDIWITNIIEGVTNKRVKTFLESQKLTSYRDQKLRNNGLVKYRRQFLSLNFQTAKFPTDLNELLIEARALKNFLNYRAKRDYNDESLKPHFAEFIKNEALYDSKDFYELCMIIAAHFDLEDSTKADLKKAISAIRTKHDPDSAHIFELLLKQSKLSNGFNIESEKKLASYIDRSIQDNASSYFDMLDTVNGKGYIHPEATNAIREYYYKNEGLSQENESVRQSINSKLSHYVGNLTVEEYNDYFEINKTFAEYIDIFGNQKFNQNLKDLSLKYIQKCLKFYKDKRSKEYQDIKKFVKATFLDYGFMTDKQLVELFKTKRKPKAVTK